jgi:hypothetical protein
MKIKDKNGKYIINRENILFFWKTYEASNNVEIKIALPFLSLFKNRINFIPLLKL